eukprot:3563138-Rhodomonas_salina.1
MPAVGSHLFSHPASLLLSLCGKQVGGAIETLAFPQAPSPPCLGRHGDSGRGSDSDSELGLGAAVPRA